MQAIKIIAFDADDTLWANEPLYRNCENRFAELLSNYGSVSDLRNVLFSIEMQNLSSYGYGAKSFSLSMIEAALKISNGNVASNVLQEIIVLGKGLINQDVELLPNVKEVLQFLSQKHPLVLATKGDLLDQERKLLKSGLDSCFHHIEVMTDKKTNNYERLFRQLNCNPEEFLMIGNSIRSDILPVLELGGKAIYVPYHTTWQHETISEAELKNQNITQVENIIDVLKWFE